MAQAHDPTNNPPESLSPSTNNSNEAGGFECNICFDLAQDPVITLCGHLYCWPCLYKWLRGHSQCHECPICKALIEEEKVIPLYGRGKLNPTDPRSKPVPGFEIPNWPVGLRPETAPTSEGNVASVMLGIMGGFVPVASAHNFGMYAGFGGVLSPIFGVHLNGFGHGGSPGYRYGYDGSFSGSEGQPNSGASRADDENLKKLLFLVLFCVIFTFLVM
ncbi:E3 ubiquitin-protein ligase rnf5 [Phtheirospermum japonicum]|uniref:E3 ubiquitin-protein ligase RMA n=1 Tax=Phtheirospermum japonicum TaxID=374723 RepID=A0A830B6U3_9LAMI|nr:E3 ubiquitin-protein ligase rnf5 [Phtheirospermum japonicum]